MTIQRGATGQSHYGVPPFEAGLAGMGSFLPTSQKGRLGGISPEVALRHR